MNFIHSQPHPETNESACTWLVPNASEVMPYVSAPSLLCTAVFEGTRLMMAVADLDNSRLVRVYRGSESMADADPFLRLSLELDVKSVSLVSLDGGLHICVFSDIMYIYNLQGEIVAHIDVHAESATVSQVQGHLYIVADGRVAKLDQAWALNLDGFHDIRIRSTADYDFGTRKDAVELAQHGAKAVPTGRYFTHKGQLFYVFGDHFDRCGSDNFDTFVCEVDQMLQPYSRRYLALPNGGNATFFESPSGEVYAAYVGQTEQSCVKDHAAILPLEYTHSSFLRPSRAFVTEKTLTAAIQPLPMHDEIRDSFVYNCEDGWYYITGTTRRSGGSYWSWTNGIRLWRTKNFSDYEDFGVVYDYTLHQGAWQAQASRHMNTWAPEIVYHDGTFWITYSTAPGCGLLKSASGTAKGPYIDMGRVVMKGIDSGFYAQDGDLYLVWQNGLLAKFVPGCISFEAEPILLLPIDGQQVGYEGAGIIRVRDKYVLYAAEWNGDRRIDGSYDMMYSVADNLHGPYNQRRVLIPHAGHGSLFYSKEGKLCFSMFGNDRTAAFRHSFAIGEVKVDFDQDGLRLGV